MRRIRIVAIFAFAVVLAWPAMAAASGAATFSQNLQVPVYVTPPLPAGAGELYAKLDPRVPGRLQPWLGQEAQRLSLGQTNDLNWPNPNDQALAGMNLSGADIEALTFIVMMQATQNADQDLKDIMAQVKAQTAAKAKLRSLIAQVNADVANNAGKKATDACSPPACGAGLSQLPGMTSISASMRSGPAPAPSPPVTVGDLGALDKNLKSQLDSMNELSEMTSLRLQMLMDRRSKFISTLSNVMKKISSTADTIIQNLK